MTKRLNPIERLARDICWAGFHNPRLTGKTKVAYWLSLPEASRESYIREAKQFAYLLQRLPIGTINAIHDRADMTS